MWPRLEEVSFRSPQGAEAMRRLEPRPLHSATATTLRPSVAALQAYLLNGTIEHSDRLTDASDSERIN